MNSKLKYLKKKENEEKEKEKERESKRNFLLKK